MNIFRDIFLTKKEKEYLKLYQKKYHKFSFKEKKYVLKIYRDNISDNELKEKICDFFNIENEKDWNDLLKEYCLENVFKS